MASPYVTGSCWLYVGIPTNFAALIPIAVRPPDPVVLRAPVNTGIPGLPAGATINNNLFDPPPPVNDFLAVFLRTVAPLFLGTCEDTPFIDFQPAYLSVPCDETGQTYGFDQLYDGQEADIVCTLTFWNEGVASFLAGYAAGSILNQAAPRGIDLDGYVGTLMATEGANVPVWLVFPYAAKPQYGLNFMPVCYRFYSCRLVHNGLRDLSTKPKKVLLAWRAQRLLAPGLGSFLYDHVLGPGLPPPN